MSGASNFGGKALQKQDESISSARASSPMSF
jgi:hypothetical protein